MLSRLGYPAQMRYKSLARGHEGETILTLAAEVTESEYGDQPAQRPLGQTKHTPMSASVRLVSIVGGTSRQNP
jgi:hypothetical protein